MLIFIITSEHTGLNNPESGEDLRDRSLGRVEDPTYQEAALDMRAMPGTGGYIPVTRWTRGGLFRLVLYLKQTHVNMCRF